MWMLFCKCFIAGLGLMFGAEIALGLAIAFGDATKGDNK